MDVVARSPTKSGESRLGPPGSNDGGRLVVVDGVGRGTDADRDGAIGRALPPDQEVVTVPLNGDRRDAVRGVHGPRR